MRSFTSSESDEAPREAQNYFRGVYPCGKRWKAQIHFEGAQHYLGTYETPEEAAKAYDQAAREHHGDRGKTNFDLNGELSESIKRRRARPRTHHRRGSATAKAAAISPTHAPSSAYHYSVLGKRSLEYMPLPRPELQTLSSFSSSGYAHDADGNTIDSFGGSISRLPSPETESVHSQIAMLSESRNRLESLLHHPAAAGIPIEDLHDEYVVCMIRLDDLMRRVRRKDAHNSSQAPTATPSPQHSPLHTPAGKPGSMVPDMWHSSPTYPAPFLAPIQFPMRGPLPLTTAAAPGWT